MSDNGRAGSTTGRSADERDEIRALLEGAGRRPAVATEDLAAIKAAARIEWRRLMAAGEERRHRLYWLVPAALAASLLLALAIGRWWMGGEAPLAADPIATADAVRGSAWVEPGPGGGATRFELAAGERLLPGTALATAGGGSAGRVALRLAGGQAVRLDSDSRLRLVSSARLELDSGAVYVDSGAPSTGGGALEVVTALGRVLEVGTQFEVRVGGGADGALRVRVREGAVSVVVGSGSHPVVAGEELRLSRDGTVARATVEPHGPAWAWTLAAAPGLDIEGLALSAFLEWASRETGWRVRYADEALAGSLAAIRLHGTIEGLRPDEAVGVVLAGAGFDHRVEEGMLLVTRPATGHVGR